MRYTLRTYIPAGITETMSSSDESSSEDDTRPVPVFVPKSQRTTVQERAEKEAALQEAKDQREKELNINLAQQRHHAVRQAIEEEETDPAEKVRANNASDEWNLAPPPIGDEDTPEEFQQWKLRELKRVLAIRKTGCFEVDDDAN
jgi:flagellar biosynthesis GTPase FlhF